MSREIIDVLNIGIVLFIGWLVFRQLALRKINYIKSYKSTSLLFFSATLVPFLLYLRNIKSIHFSFSFAPFSFLILFYFSLFFIYHLMKRHIDFTLIEQLETKRVYFASISYRYIVYKSFDILFQQMSILCVITLLNDINIPYLLLVLFFAISFAVSHIFMLNRGSLIGIIFLIAALLGGLIFPLLLSFQYGIVYTFILHWSFYIFLGVLAHFSHKVHASLKSAL